MISEQDFDQLSAYLDNQLSTKEKLALEARLLVEPELKATLRALRLQTRALRDLPTVKVPRNFTLTAKQAEAIRPTRRSFFETLFPAFRLATSLSATAFVVLLMVSVLNTSMLAQPQTVSAPMVADAPLEEAAREAATSVPEADAGNAAGATGPVLGTPEMGGDVNLFATSDGSETQVALMPPDVMTETQNLTSMAMTDTVTKTGEVAQVTTPAPEETVQVFIPAVGGSVPASEPAPATPDTTLWLVGLGALTAVLAALTWLARRR